MSISISKSKSKKYSCNRLNSLIISLGQYYIHHVMKTEIKKVIVFGVIITFFTSAYAALLNTTMKQGFFTDHFFVNWVRLIPMTYLLLLPFVLITGPVTRALVDRIFRNGSRTK